MVREGVGRGDHETVRRDVGRAREPYPFHQRALYMSENAAVPLFIYTVCESVPPSRVLLGGGGAIRGVPLFHIEEQRRHLVFGEDHHIGLRNLCSDTRQS